MTRGSRLRPTLFFCSFSGRRISCFQAGRLAEGTSARKTFGNSFLNLNTQTTPHPPYCSRASLLLPLPVLSRTSGGKITADPFTKVPGLHHLADMQHRCDATATMRKPYNIFADCSDHASLNGDLKPSLWIHRCKALWVRSLIIHRRADSLPFFYISCSFR